MTARAQKAAELVWDRVSVPTLPTTLASVYRVLDDSDSGATSIAEAIGCDPAIAAKVLRLANSAYYSPAEPIRSLQRAVMTLGVNIIRRVVVHATVLNCYEHLLENDNFDLRSYWGHSIRSAISARTIARLSPKALPLHPEEYYTAGLLQNVGILILLDAVPDMFVQAQQESEERQEPLIKSEQRVMGTDHATVGALFAEEWRLDESIIEAARFHHAENPPGQGRAVWALSRLADTLAEKLTPKVDIETVLRELDTEILVSLSLRRSDLEGVASHLVDEFQNIDLEEFLGKGEPAG